MRASTQYTSIGGQAVIEGVMMRSPRFIAVAVRKPNQRIMIRNGPYEGIGFRYPVLKKPLLRGVVTLVESMIQGIEALSYSANLAAAEEPAAAATEKQDLSKWAIAGSIAVAFAFGMGLFVALPHFLTAVLTSTDSINSPLFHLVDGLFKVAILLAYVYLIALMKDIRRVFQYHGAEHKSIYTFEAGEELTVENARKHSRLHPRCGTSFLLFLVLISIFVFSAVFPLLQLAQFSSVPFLNHLLMVLTKIVLMFPVAGFAYEFIKLCAGHMDRAFFRALIWPGLVLQNLTTREPADDQLEVALASLRQVIKAEKERGRPDRCEMEIGALSEISLVPATVSEFPEG